MSTAKPPLGHSDGHGDSDAEGIVFGKLNKKTRQSTGALPEGYQVVNLDLRNQGGQKLRDTPKRPKRNTPGAPPGWK